MSNVNPNDPFGLASKTRASMAAAGAPAADTGTQEAEQTPVKSKRTYVKRGAAVSDESDAELVLGYFSTGGLSIRKGRQTLELTPSERAQLYAFMEKVE